MIGLVLEGGGMRGAYTAGVLSWFIDKNIEFDYSVGISSGAVHLCSYHMKSKEYLYDISCKYLSNTDFVGVKNLFMGKRYVDYEYLFHTLLRDKIGFDSSVLKDSNINFEMGVFDLRLGDTVYMGPKHLDSDNNFLMATCSLPIASEIVKIGDNLYLDGGIKTMIPTDRSIEKGCDKNFIISTKPSSYVRKKPNSFMINLMKKNYKGYPNLAEYYSNRHIEFKREVEQAEELEKLGKAFFLRPSEVIDVKRFSADFDNLNRLYELGYKDASLNEERIIEFING